MSKEKKESMPYLEFQLAQALIYASKPKTEKNLRESKQHTEKALELLNILIEGKSNP